jgi:HK97 family phage prohead protease
VKYYEEIDSNAFDGCDLSDVIFNYNHAGKVLARLRNKTLQLAVNNDGLHVRANLAGTAQGRELFEEIRGGYVDRMSFQFVVAEDSYNIETHTRKILKIKKLYDVSAVDIPAYDTTSLSARTADSVVYERFKDLEQSETLERKRLELDAEISIIIGGI